MTHFILIVRILKGMSWFIFKWLRSLGFLFLVFCLACNSYKERRPDIPVGMSNNRNQLQEDLNEFVVFVYHRFGDPRHLSTNVNLDDFRRHLLYLQEENFEVMTLSQALSTPANKSVKRAVITIDDSYRSFLKNGFPILEEFDFPATLFVSTSTVGGEDFLTWEELQYLVDKGIEIGNHSHNHSYFLDFPSNVYLDSFRMDVMNAQKLLEDSLSISPKLFAYPYGEYDIRMQEVIKEMGFHAAVAQNSGVVLEGQDMFALPRFPISDTYADMESFKDKSNAHAFQVTMESPSSPVIKTARPVWKLMARQKLSRARIQCFVQGGFCQMDSSGDTLIVTSEFPLKSRRTVYTVTMPDGKGEWYWRSHLWIIPDSPDSVQLN